MNQDKPNSIASAEITIRIVNDSLQSSVSPETKSWHLWAASKLLEAMGDELYMRGRQKELEMLATRVALPGNMGRVPS